MAAVKTETEMEEASKPEALNGEEQDVAEDGDTRPESATKKKKKKKKKKKSGELAFPINAKMCHLWQWHMIKLTLSVALRLP